MQKEDCFLFGTVFKLHGYKGDVNIYNDNNILLDFSTLKYFLIELNNKLVPFFIEQVRSKKPNIVLVKFEDVNSEQEAKTIHKRKVYVSQEWIPKEDKDKIDEDNIIGYSVIDTNLGKLGKVIYINSQTAQQLIYVKKGNKEFCFPMHEKFVKGSDSKEKILKIEINEELLNLN
jgi:16S rRNA processing protein RimM